VAMTTEAALELSEKAVSMVEEWKTHALTVTSKSLKGDPLEVLPKMALHFGLIVCPPGRKNRRRRLGKLTKKMVCSSQFNLLVVP